MDGDKNCGVILAKCRRRKEHRENFMSFAKPGYEAKHYEMVNELTVKELYYKYAEGRDEGYYIYLTGKV